MGFCQLSVFGDVTIALVILAILIEQLADIQATGNSLRILRLLPLCLLLSDHIVEQVLLEGGDEGALVLAQYKLVEEAARTLVLNMLQDVNLFIHPFASHLIALVQEVVLLVGQALLIQAAAKACVQYPSHVVLSETVVELAASAHG